MRTNAEPTVEDEAGEEVDRWIGRTIAATFRLERLIGEGAMGRVYRAKQLSLGKAVAIKVLHRHLGGDPRIAKRFHREAKAASRLSHPNSLSIIDFGADDDGTLFIAMELLEGEDLQTIIDHDAPLSPARIADLMKQTLRALDEAHHAGIIHRDLKPENVVVVPSRDGERVKVCDFGIAKIIEPETRSTAITKDGYVCGTPEYMAPEQARGEEIDHRADVYAAGAMLYQLLCGRVPFKAENALGIITKHLMEIPQPPRKIQPTWGIPRSLQRISLKALEKAPDDRFASAKDMSRAIDEAMITLGDLAQTRLGEGAFAADLDEDEDDEPAPPSSTQEVIAQVVPDKRTWLYGVALALVAGAAGIVWYGGRPEDPSGTISSSPEHPTADPPEVPGRDPSPLAATGDPDPEGADTEGADTEGADTEGADTEGADTEGADTEGADTEGVDTEGADTEGADTEGADTEGAASSDVAATPPEPATPHPRRGRRRSTDGRAPARSALEQGRQAMLGGDLSGAIAHFERAARANPNDAQVQKQLGRAYMRSGAVSRGVNAYRRYLRLAPNAPDRAIIERILAPHGP